MYTCQKILDFMADYLDGNLSEEEHKSFEEHVNLCWPCREYMKTYKQTIEMARSCKKEDPKPEQVPEDLISAILTAAPRIMAGGEGDCDGKGK